LPGVADQAATVPSPGARGLSVETAVRVEGAAVRHGRLTVWSRVDLTVRTGDFVALLGPNGAGKTTLVKAILGVQPLAEGSVSVFGRRVSRGNSEIGYLPQRRHFDPDLRIRGVDLVRLGLDGNRWGVPLPFAGRLLGGDAGRRVRDAIEMVDAAAYAERPIGELS